MFSIAAATKSPERRSVCRSQVCPFNSFAAKQNSTRLFSLADKQVQASNLGEILNVDIPVILDHIK